MNTDTMIPIGHKTLRLRDLLPEKSAAFSPNLYRWMKEHAHFYTDGGTAEGVYRVRAGTKAESISRAGALYIGHPINGYPGDTDFSGSRLMGALCVGVKETRSCFAGIAPDLDLIEGFWDQYLQVGRCAIDPEHQENFTAGGERFSMDGDARTCLWCGHQQRRVITPRTVFDETWVTS